MGVPPPYGGLVVGVVMGVGCDGGGGSCGGYFIVLFIYIIFIMATRKKIVLRRQRRSALNRRKRQTGKRIYRRKVMRGGMTYKQLGLALMTLPDIKNAITNSNNGNSIDLTREEQITAESIKTDIVPIVQGQIKTTILEKIPQDKKLTVEPLLDSLFNIITNPPSNIDTAKEEIKNLFEQLDKTVNIPFAFKLQYAAIKLFLPKLLDIIDAASRAPASPSAAPAAPAAPAAHSLDLS